MSSVKFKVVSVFFKLNSTLKQELGRDMSRTVVGKAKCHYKELDKLKPKEKGVMRVQSKEQCGFWGLLFIVLCKMN